MAPRSVFFFKFVASLSLLIIVRITFDRHENKNTIRFSKLVFTIVYRSSTRVFPEVIPVIADYFSKLSSEKVCYNRIFFYLGTMGCRHITFDESPISLGGSRLFKKNKKIIKFIGFFLEFFVFFYFRVVY